VPAPWIMWLWFPPMAIPQTIGQPPQTPSITRSLRGSLRACHESTS